MTLRESIILARNIMLAGACLGGLAFVVAIGALTLLGLFNG